MLNKSCELAMAIVMVPVAMLIQVSPVGFQGVLLSIGPSVDVVQFIL